MPPNTFTSEGIVERIELMTLWRELDLSGMGHKSIIEFTSLIGFVVEQNVSAFVEHGGIQIINIASYHDVRLFGRCVTNQEIGDEVNRWMKFHSVTMESSLHVVTVAKQVVTPVLYDTARMKPGIWGRTEYPRPGDDWSTDKAALEEVINYWKDKNPDKDWPDHNGARLKAVERAEVIIGRSNWTPEHNEQARQDYIDRHILSIKPASPPPTLPAPVDRLQP